MADREIADARAAVSKFAHAVAGADKFGEQLADEYHQLRKALAFQFQQMALRDLPVPTPSLAAVRDKVTTEMRAMFGNSVDDFLLTVRGYTSVHPALYALLMANVGRPVPAWRLRILTADAVHTERRTRELRDLGFDLETWSADDEPYYRLTSATADLRYAAAFQLRLNAADSKKLNGSRKQYVIGIAESAADLPPRGRNRP